MRSNLDIQHLGARKGAIAWGEFSSILRRDGRSFQRNEPAAGVFTGG
jgi:hypothetical protein